MKVYTAALKNGIKAEDVTQASTWSLWVENVDDDSPAGQLMTRFDTHGHLPETVVIVFDGGNERVIHARRARPQIFELLPKYTLPAPY